jgi:hypothetical protein
VTSFIEQKTPHVKVGKRKTSIRRGFCPEKIWRPRRDLNPCYRRERAMS